jgi:hypothetical protein
MISATLFTLWAAAAGPPKLPPALAKEMSDAVVAVDKALGLESWPTHGAEPCVKRAGPENPTQDVSRDDTRTCATAALAGFPALGKAYVVAVLMAPMGPTTVFAVGLEQAAGWGAYSCDPGRKCPPTAMSSSTKWGKRLVERHQKACASDTTLWFPADGRACPAADKSPPKP